jgi:hypothetical protein
LCSFCKLTGKKILLKLEINTSNTQTIKNFDNIPDAIEFLLTECSPEELAKLSPSYCKFCGKKMKAHEDPNFLCMNPHCENYIKINKKKDDEDSNFLITQNQRRNT